LAESGLLTSPPYRSHLAGSIRHISDKIDSRAKADSLMNEGIKTIIFPVSDINKAKALYGTLFASIIRPTPDSRVLASAENPPCSGRM
jgi:hypothetical protein